MRELKFRAYSNGEMQYSKEGLTDFSFWKWVGYDSTTKVMQFTGLNDKNKKECYEKDYDKDGNMIDFCHECSGYQFFQIDIPTKDIIFCHNCEGNFMLQDHIKDFEIVGNLYES